MDKNTHMQLSNSHKIGIIVAVFILLLIVMNTLDSIFYRNYLTEYERIIAVTTESFIGGNVTMSIGHHYVYKIENKLYRGLYSIPKDSQEKRLKCPKHKYLVIYSKKNPAYHALIPIEVTKDNYKSIEFDESMVKKKFGWLNNKAKIIKK